MGKKLGLDKQYSSLLTSVNKNSPTNLMTNSTGNTFRSKAMNLAGSKVGKTAKFILGRTPIGKAVNLAINVGSGIGIGYSYAKNKFNKKKGDFQKGDYSDIKKKSAGGEMNQMNIKGYMEGGASRGYGAARTSGMGLQDESLKPGKMVRAKNGKMVKMNRGGGMDAGAAQNKADFRARAIKYAQKNKGEDRLTQSDIKMAKKTLTALDKLKK